MKPDWDKLTEEFPDAVFDVDCTSGGKEVCQEIGVAGYPTIKYGDSNDRKALKDYTGGRDFESLKTFASEHCSPACGPSDVEACDEADKVLLEKFAEMSASELSEAVKATKKKLADMEKPVKKKEEALADSWSEYNEDFELSKTATPKDGEDKEHRRKQTMMEFRKEALERDEKLIDKAKGHIKDEAKTSGYRIMNAVLKTKWKSEL